MKLRLKHLSGLAMAAGLAASSSAFATNGYFQHGYGNTSMSMGGTGVAFSQDTLSAATNPAGMVNVGDRMDLGVLAFAPIRSTDVSGGGFFYGPFSFDEDSGSELFLIPSFGYNKMINDKMSLGVSVYGNGGMNTSWDANAGPGSPPAPFRGLYYAGGAGVNLAQMFILPTLGYKATDNISLGFSPVLAVQRFRANGVGSFFFATETFNRSGGTVFPTKLTDNGSSVALGIGGKVGIQAKVMDGLTLGASYQSKIYMEEYDDYADLFAESGDFDVPPTYTVGLAFQPNDAMAFTFDVQWIDYEEVDSISNGIENLFNCPAFGGTNLEACLGGDDGAGFGWEDMTIYKAGFQYDAGNDWTWRAGLSYGDQPIPSDQVLFNQLAPGIMEWHITGGFTKSMGKNNDLNVGLFYSPEETVEGRDALTGDLVELEMWQAGVDITWTWKF